MDVPIIFSGPMVKALLDDRKTMTRRLRWAGRKAADGEGFRESAWARAKIGDRLWVRERHWRWGRWYKDGKTKTGRQRWRFKVSADPHVIPVIFDEPPGPKPDRETIGFHKRPSIFLPREHSRLTLILTAAKIERLQDISEADAIAEGLIRLPARRDGFGGDWHYRAEGLIYIGPSPVKAYADLWQHLHGADAWDANPEVVALTFTVHKQNIDALPADAIAA